MGGGCTESVCEAWAGDGLLGLLVSVWGGDAQTLFVRFASPPRLLRDAEYLRQGDRLHIGPGSLGIPRKTYFYIFFWIFGVILIKYLGFWSK